MTTKDLQKIIIENIQNTTEEFKRVFHGRGNSYDDYNYLTIDSIDKILFIALFEEIDVELENQLLKIIKDILETTNHETLVLQRRYLDKSPCEVLKGELKKDNFAIENSIKYKISFTNKNIGFFPDMRNGHDYILQT